MWRRGAKEAEKFVRPNEVCLGSAHLSFRECSCGVGDGSGSNKRERDKAVVPAGNNGRVIGGGRSWYDETP